MTAAPTTRPARIDLPRNQVALIGAGAFAVTQLPQWVVVLRRWYGWDVRVCLTHSATALVAPAALAAASGHAVIGPDWHTGTAVVPHRELSEWADLVVVAPATTAFLGKLAAGIPDSLALSVVMDTRAPVVLAPSIPEGMVGNRAVRRNLACLEEYGCHVVPTVEGRSLSDGQRSTGAMADITAVLRTAARAARAAEPPSDTELRSRTRDQ